MTVATTHNTQNFAGAQSVLTFTFESSPDRPEDILVDETVIATGVKTTLEYDVAYTVAVNADGVGGTATVSPTHAATSIYTVYRSTTTTQSSDYDDYNQFPADTLESNLDQVTFLAQEAKENLTRTLAYPISYTGATATLPNPVADNFLVWNATATAVVNAEIPDPSTLIKASVGEAQAGTEDTHFMTPSKTADAITALSSGSTIASQAQAESASSNVVVMTPLQVKNEVQKGGAVAIPNENIVLTGIPSIVVTNAAITNQTTTTLNITTIRLALPTTGALIYDDGTILTYLPQGADGESLISGGTGVAPSFGTLATGTEAVSFGLGNSPHTWSVPTGVDHVIVSAVGGGGGGGGGVTSSSAHGGAGGGGGESMVNWLFPVNAGSDCTITIGVGGGGGNANQDTVTAGSGGTTSVTGAGTDYDITLTGGLGGASSGGVVPSGGAGAVGSITSVNHDGTWATNIMSPGTGSSTSPWVVATYSGGAGANNGGAPANIEAEAGGASYFGAGGAGGTASAQAGSAGTLGGGGGGGAGNAGGGGSTGAVGGAGFVMFRYAVTL